MVEFGAVFELFPFIVACISGFASPFPLVAASSAALASAAAFCTAFSAFSFSFVAATTAAFTFASEITGIFSDPKELGLFDFDNSVWLNDVAGLLEGTALEGTALEVDGFTLLLEELDPSLGGLLFFFDFLPYFAQNEDPLILL